MLTKISSGSLAQLSNHLSKQITRRIDPFRKHWIVVQNNEMKQWLNLQLADRTGIAANYQFVYPSELLWKFYRMYQPDTPKNLPSDIGVTEWQIIDLMNDPGFELNGLNIPANQDQKYYLSTAIADVFDLYQMYRPEMIEAWENGLLTTRDPDERWQLMLWNKLSSQWSQNYPELPGRVDAYHYLLKKLQHKSVLIPETLFVFGLSHLPGPFSKILNACAKYSEIQVYQSVPGNTSDQSLRSLYKEWGQPQESSYKLLEVDKQVMLDSDDHFVAEMITNSAEQALEFHACHNERREVDILRDFILAQLDKNEEDTVSDFLILVPDTEIYAPLIRSAFAESDDVEIPISVPFTQVHSLHYLMDTLRTLVSEEYRISDVISLLNTDYIKQQFEFNDEQIQTLIEWMNDTNTHWGLNSGQSEFSVKKAKQALFSGFMMSPEKYQSFGDHVPQSYIQSRDDFSLINKLSAFLSALDKIEEQKESKKSVSDWIAFWNKWIVESGLPTPVKRSKKINYSRDLEQLSDKIPYLKTQTKVSFDLALEWILGQISDKEAASGSVGRGIVLASYVPYRNIPFRYTAILGFGEKAFPRKPVRPGFDLIDQHPKAGDRITKMDDQLLFLEKLASTTDKLFISYVGQDENTNEEKPSSILLTKLLDAINGENTGKSGEAITVKKHRLQSFSEGGLPDGSGYSTYDSDVNSFMLSEPDFSPFESGSFSFGIDRDVSLKEVTEFFKHPAKYLCTNIYQIRDPYQKDIPVDREPFVLDALESYKVRAFILDGLLQNAEEETVKNYLSKAGDLPVGTAADYHFSKKKEEISEVAELVKEKNGNILKRLEVDLEIGAYHLRGLLNVNTDGQLILYRPGGLKGKYLTTFWLEHLVLNVIQPDSQSEFIGKDKQMVLNGLNADEAEKLLLDLISWFSETKTTDDLYFFPNSSYAFATEFEKTGEEEKSIKSADKSWYDSYRNTGESLDFYVQLLFRNQEPLQSNSFKKLALKFWAPFLKEVSS